MGLILPTGIIGSPVRMKQPHETNAEPTINLMIEIVKRKIRNDWNEVTVRAALTCALGVSFLLVSVRPVTDHLADR